MERRLVTATSGMKQQAWVVVLVCGDEEVPLQQGVVPAEISYCGPTVEVAGAAASDQWGQAVAEVSIRRRETVR